MTAVRMVLTWLFFSTCGTLLADQIVYVSLSGENRIAVYQLEPSSGRLLELSDVQTDGGPGALCLHPSGKYLLASIKSVGNLASFRIVGDGLEQIDQIPAGADPSFLATDPSGKFLISAYYRAGKVMVHSIGDDGRLDPQPLQSIDTDEKAHGVVFDASGRFVFVPHTGPNAIFQFRFEPTSGRLMPNRPAKVQRPQQSGPRHLWFRPDGKFAYGSDEQGNSVTAYQFDSQTGTLLPMQTVSTLPADFDQRNSTSDIEVHPSGKFVFVANRGHDSIARFAIDSDGKVSHLGNTATEKTTRSFNIDREGKLMIAAGQNSDRIATFRIRSDGSLDRLATTAVGSKPWWVLVVNR